jgi:hypothetical protein
MNGDEEEQEEAGGWFSIGSEGGGGRFEFLYAGEEEEIRVALFSLGKGD